MPTPTPIPVSVASDIPEWLTGIAVPIAAAIVAALIVLAGFVIDAKQRDRQRRAAFVDELSQLLIANARARQTFVDSADDIAREGMTANRFRVRAVAQMKKREFPVYHFASRTAGDVLSGKELAPQGATALAITHLLEWLTGERKTNQFPKPGDPETVVVDRE